MSKKSKKPTARAATSSPKAETLRYSFGDNDDWDYGEIKMFAVYISTTSAKPTYAGGWKKEPPLGRLIFRAYFGQEESCCGIPLMMDFWEAKEISNAHIKEMGAKLTEHLQANCLYMQAYLPDKSAYKAAKKVLEAAGFKMGLSLQSSHGKYNNCRWEWFPNPEAKNEKIVATLAV